MIEFSSKCLFALLAAFSQVAVARTQSSLATEPANVQPESKVRTARVAAATSSAIDSLAAQVAATRISPNLTVLEFLDKTDSAGELQHTLHSARQVGGPRWLDDQTCQVKVEIEGATLSRALVDIAIAHAEQSPIPAQVLSSRLREWKGRSFSATGMSTTFERAARAKPIADREAWDTISDDARTSAVALAKLDAATRLLDSVKSVQLAPGVTVSDALANESVRERMTDWLAARPITRLDFHGDLLVEVRVAASAGDVFDALADALQTTDVKIAADDMGLATARAAFERQLTDPVGMAFANPEDSAAVTGNPPPPGAHVVIPENPPAWVTAQLDAEGIAPVGGSGARLRVQRAAQNNAIDALREKLGALRLNEDVTLGDAAKTNPRIADAISRALVRARVFKVDYRDDGSVMVRIAIDGRSLWNELDDAR